LRDTDGVAEGEDPSDEDSSTDKLKVAVSLMRWGACARAERP
jgi:hypothetical protein